MEVRSPYNGSDEASRQAACFKSNPMTPTTRTSRSCQSNPAPGGSARSFQQSPSVPVPLPRHIGTRTVQSMVYSKNSGTRQLAPETSCGLLRCGGSFVRSDILARNGKFRIAKATTESHFCLLRPVVVFRARQSATERFNVVSKQR